METVIMLILWIAVVIIWGKNVRLFIKLFQLWKENKIWRRKNRNNDI